MSNAHIRMIVAVAEKLGDELLQEVVLVGGCATSLLLTSDVALSDVRHTEDVDLIVHVVGLGQWYALQRKLERRGFRQSDGVEDAPVCAMMCGEVRVDFMPDDPAILGFSNRWYGEAVATALERDVQGHRVRLVSPAYFVATKLEAYKGRGGGDMLASRDIEDLVVLFGGRTPLMTELGAASLALRAYLAEAIGGLLMESDLKYAVLGSVGGDRIRAERVERRLKNIGSSVFDD